jgi:diguanylate cyclase (GGDEF)-like protein
MEIKLYFKMLRNGWWIIVITAFAAVVAAMLTAYYTKPTFQSKSRFVVSPNPAFVTGQSNVLDSLSVLDRRSIITTYAEILNSPRIYRDTIDQLQLKEADLVDYSYSAVVLPDTNIIEFSVQGPNAATTAMLANSIAQRAVDYVANLYQVYEMTLLDPATASPLPISPQPLRDAGIALVVGLAAGVGLATIRELLFAPIQNFMEQRRRDEQSQALRHDAFEERLEEVAFASVNDFSLCMVHLDGFNKYIKVLPQPTLQTILRHVNQTLRNQLRGNDMVGRWNDTDFAVLLSETPGDASMNTMGRVRAALSIPIKIDVSGEDLYLKPQIGIAEYRVGDNAQSLIKNTNWALEIAKQNDDGMYLLRATESI